MRRALSDKQYVLFTKDQLMSNMTENQVVKFKQNYLDLSKNKHIVSKKQDYIYNKNYEKKAQKVKNNILLK